MRVFPNPAKGEVNLAFEMSKSQHWQFQVFNALGQVVRHYAAPPGGSARKNMLIEDLPGSVYFFSLKLNNRARTQKVMVTGN